MPRIRINDIHINYEIHGEATKPTLVFVSGFTADHTVWASVVDRYLADYQILIFDNRGIGGTDAPEDEYTTDMMADDTIGLLDALQIDKAYFVGHSFGGAIVQTIAYKYPSRVHSIVLVCSTPTKIGARAKLYADSRLLLMESEVAANEAFQKVMMHFITATCWGEEYLARPAMASSLVSQGFSSISLAGYAGQKNAIETFDSSEWLDEIGCRCLIIASDDDVFISHKEWRRLSDTMPQASFCCIPDAGHMPFIEKPDNFHRALATFLAPGVLATRDISSARLFSAAAPDMIERDPSSEDSDPSGLTGEC